MNRKIVVIVMAALTGVLLWNGALMYQHHQEEVDSIAVLKAGFSGGVDPKLAP